MYSPEKRRAYYLKRREKALTEMKEYAKNNPEKIKQISKNWVKNNPEKRKLTIRKNKLKSKFKIDILMYEKLYKKQKGVCSICKRSCKTFRNLAVDHCHKTNKIRGLLCFSCNIGIGKFEDNVDYLKSAIKYINKNRL